jgi:hypothetical protein
MCGLYGGFGKRVDYQAIRTLALLNESRGRDATGIFNSLGNRFKENERSTKFLQNPELARWLIDSSNHCWAICGHCRGGTRGGNTTENAHPFKYGKVIGSHNGVLDAPNKYKVDTEYAIDLLSQAKPGHYQDALKDVVGWYVLTWIDMRDRKIRLLNWKGTLHLARFGGSFYYSSEADHLKTALGVADKAIIPITHQQVYEFTYDQNKGVMASKMPDFTGKERPAVVVDRTNYLDRYPGSNHYAPTRQRSNLESNWMEPTGFLVKFPDGLWCAEMMNHMFRLLTNQAELNESYKDSKPGECRWRQPYGIKQVYATLSPSTPMRHLPDGFEVPSTKFNWRQYNDHAGGSLTKQELKKTEEEGDDTKIITIAEEKALSPSQLKALKPPSEDDQENAERIAAEQAMDSEARALAVLASHKSSRLAFLVDVVKLTPEEATSVMTDEGYYEMEEELIVS